MHEERRESQRHHADQLRATLRRRGLLARLGAGLPCRVMDVNRAGIGLFTRTRLGPGTEVLVDLRLQGIGALRLSGLVQYAKRHDAAHYRLGIEFDPFGPEAEHNTPKALDRLREIEAALSDPSAVPTGD